MIGRAAFRWIRSFARPQADARIDLNRRSLITAGILGLSGGFLSRIEPLAGDKTYDPALIRPPGSVAEPEFRSRCIRCGECMKVCPTNGIHPTFLEAGFEGMWSPVMKMKVGYCEYECTLCTQVCPTDAIRELGVEEKKKVKIGLAFIDKNRCLPFAYARSCIVCEEHCPTPKKAIWFEEAEVMTIGGERLTVKQPHVDAELCIGCGICENKCPVADQRAIYVTSVGEARNPKNQILLADPYGGGSPY